MLSFGNLFHQTWTVQTELDSNQCPLKTRICLLETYSIRHILVFKGHWLESSSVCNHSSAEQNRMTAKWESHLITKSLIQGRIWGHKVLVTINNSIIPVVDFLVKKLNLIVKLTVCPVQLHRRNVWVVPHHCTFTKFSRYLELFTVFKGPDNHRIGKMRLSM